MEQLKTIGRELAIGSHGGWGQSKEFLDLVKSIGEARSKAEEDRIILREVESLRRRIAEPDVPRRKMKEYIIRLVYAEMLGHDASFGYIHAVKMTHDDALPLKRTGYLAVTLFLSEDHDLIILIVNTIQKDLRSDNYLVVCAALAAVCKLINEETIPAVLPQVVDLLAHPKEAVRRKAVMALHRFYQRSPASRLCDNDPGVMGATLCPLFDLISADVNSYKDLVISFVGILKQVAERRLPKTYDYHQMAAPFIQIKLLKILALLGSGDKQASGHMYNVLGDIFRKCEQSSNIGNAVLYESICCVSSIYPNAKLLEAAAEATSKFLKARLPFCFWLITSDSHNLKYMGVDALGRLIRINPDIAEEHQLAVIDCLEDPDDTLKRKTFELLYKMTKPTNVEVIVDRMIEYMINISDNHYKTEIASRCVELAEQFAPTNEWFIRVDSYLRILGEPKLPSLFLQVICWVLGEYGTADGKYPAAYIIGKLCDVTEALLCDDTVKAYAISAIMKICAFEISEGRKVEMLPECQSLIDELSTSHSTDLQQRAYELQALLCLESQAVESVMPLDASCEDIEIDKNLTFLKDFVQQSIENGARPYIPESERSGTSNVSNFKSQYQHEASSHMLRFEAYELPRPSPAHVIPQVSVPTPIADFFPVPETTYNSETSQASKLSSVADASSAAHGIKLHLDGVQRRWGRPTYSSSSGPSSTTSTEKTTNGVTHIDGVGSQSRDKLNESRRQQPEVSAEKQKLAASLFGGSAGKTEKKATSTQRAPKGNTRNAERPGVSRSVSPETSKEKAAPSVPDLLDLGEPNPTSTTIVDPFKQLEGLVGPTPVPSPLDNSVKTSGLETPDLMAAVYTDLPPSGSSSGSLTSTTRDMHSADKTSNTATSEPSIKKGPFPQDSLRKDARARQVGVTPTRNNPNLFKDLLG
ncbi:AP-4 complex subunit [Musa troglodytarum]|uniref:AP-4 complex subunit n=1 Tax=Musa troglodytarum TaxID=320322 RepID=A0A9E7EK66_9LILI|nr:AP-4 complex subunit [Musa troglodytarum]